jgi:serine/threonine protein phosphatase 1
MAADYLEKPWFYSVLGNHEEMFLMSIADTKLSEKEIYIEDHIRNGGGWAYKNCREWSSKIEILYHVLDKLPLIIKVGDVIIAHAAMPAVNSLEEIETDPHNYLETVLWDRTLWRGKGISSIIIPGISNIYVGHLIVKEPIVYGITTNIDTGAFLKYRGKKGKLTILEIGGEIL